MPLLSNTFQTGTTATIEHPLEVAVGVIGFSFDTSLNTPSASDGFTVLDTQNGTVSALTLEKIVSTLATQGSVVTLSGALAVPWYSAGAIVTLFADVPPAILDIELTGSGESNGEVSLQWTP